MQWSRRFSLPLHQITPGPCTRLSAYRAQRTQNLHSPARVILCTIPLSGGISTLETLDFRSRWLPLSSLAGHLLGVSVSATRLISATALYKDGVPSAGHIGKVLSKPERITMVFSGKPSTACQPCRLKRLRVSFRALGYIGGECVADFLGSGSVIAWNRVVLSVSARGLSVRDIVILLSCE